MTLPVCAHCGYEWTWKQSMQRYLAMQHIDHGMKCPSCHHQQYITKKVHRRLATIRFIPYILTIFSIFLFSLPMAILILIVSIIGMVGIHPFVMTLSNEKEPPEKPLW